MTLCQTHLVKKALNFVKYKKLALTLRLLFCIEPFLKEHFNIIHCHFGPNGIIAAYIREILKLETKIITTFHGYDLTSELKMKSNTIYKHLFENGDLFLPINEYFRNKLIDLGCNKEKIIVHHMGIELNKFEFHNKMRPNNCTIKLLTVGRLVEKKGHEYVIKALHRLLEKYDNLRYIIAGDGPLSEKLKNLIVNLDLSKYVMFIGAATDCEVVDLYNQAHIFILHSIAASNGDMEGTPVVLMEAQACGLPIISTYHSGIPEVVKDGKSGFLVPERDVDALAEKMEYLINHPELWPEMGRAGRRFVEEKYDIVKLNKRLERIYEALVNNNFSEL